MNPSDELLVRFGALRVGYRLGWFSAAAVLAALAFDRQAHHRGLLLVCTLGVAAANTVATAVPWREWLEARRGQLLLDLWCVGLILFVSLLVLEAGQSFGLLLFLTVPFIAVVQSGRRRVVWLVLAGGSCALASASAVGTAALRLALVAAITAVALVVARTLRVQRALAREADHRITNDLQAASDLLLLAGPEETAQRIRVIAAVHRALADTGGRVDGAGLLRGIAAAAPVPVDVDAESMTLDASTARTLGAVANELITNARRHGEPPVKLVLRPGRLTVADHGTGIDGVPGNGLGLVKRLVEDGLGGRFETHGARAEVTWPH
jgi:two-component sensor histidine kinase